jgi:hypothetical protein
MLWAVPLNGSHVVIIIAAVIPTGMQNSII